MTIASGVMRKSIRLRGWQWWSVKWRVGIDDRNSKSQLLLSYQSEIVFPENVEILIAYYFLHIAIDFSGLDIKEIPKVHQSCRSYFRSQQVIYYERGIVFSFICFGRNSGVVNFKSNIIKNSLSSTWETSWLQVREVFTSVTFISVFQSNYKHLSDRSH